jgi:hypothetical protein
MNKQQKRKTQHGLKIRELFTAIWNKPKLPGSMATSVSTLVCMKYEVGNVGAQCANKTVLRIFHYLAFD